MKWFQRRLIFADVKIVEVRNSQVTKSSYKTELRKICSSSSKLALRVTNLKIKLLFFYFQVINSKLKNKKLHFELLTQSRKIKKLHFELLTRSQNKKNTLSY